MQPIIMHNKGVGAIVCNKCGCMLKVRLTVEEMKGETDILTCKDTGYDCIEANSKEPEEFCNWFNGLDVGGITKVTPKRRAKVIQRIKEGIMEHLDELEEKINNSPFLLGKVARWTMTFDWLTANDTNWVKVLEGNYNDTKPEPVTNVTEYDPTVIDAVKAKMGETE